MDLPGKENPSVNKAPKTGNPFNWWWIYIFILLSIIITSILSKRSSITEITWQQF